MHTIAMGVITPAIHYFCVIKYILQQRWEVSPSVISSIMKLDTGSCTWNCLKV